DQIAMGIYKEELAAGSVTTPDLTAQFEATRALGGIVRDDPDHATAPATDAHGNGLALQPRTGDDQQTAALMRERLEAFGIPVSEEKDQEMLAQITPADLQTTYGLSDQDMFISRFADFLKDEAGIESMDKYEAANMAFEDPALLYETVRQMNARGLFADSPAQQAMATEFIAAAERYAPAHFETDIAGPDPGTAIRDRVAMDNPDRTPAIAPTLPNFNIQP